MIIRINKKNLELNNHQIKIICDILYNALNFITDLIDDCEPTEAYDVNKHKMVKVTKSRILKIKKIELEAESSVTDLIEFFEKKKQKLYKKQTLNLLSCLYDAYHNTIGELLSSIEFNIIDRDELVEAIKNREQEILELVHNEYFKFKLFLSEIEIIIKLIVIALNGSLIYPRFHNNPSIISFEEEESYLNNFYNFLDFVNNGFYL